MSGLARTPQNFPRMRYRARARHERAVRDSTPFARLANGLAAAFRHIGEQLAVFIPGILAAVETMRRALAPIIDAAHIARRLPPESLSALALTARLDRQHLTTKGPLPMPATGGHHAAIDWTRGEFTIDGHDVPWLILAHPIDLNHPHPEMPFGTVTFTVLVDRVVLAGTHIELDDTTMPWQLIHDGPTIARMLDRWAVTLPILVTTITETGDRANPFGATALDGYDDPELLEGEPLEGELLDAEEWQEGSGDCDHCLMAPGEIGPLGVCCACSIGQGAAPEDCECGPEEPTTPGSTTDPDHDRDVARAIEDEQP